MYSWATLYVWGPSLGILLLYGSYTPLSYYQYLQNLRGGCIFHDDNTPCHLFLFR